MIRREKSNAYVSIMRSDADPSAAAALDLSDTASAGLEQLPTTEEEQVDQWKIN